MFNLMNFRVAFLISISMNYATKLSTGCRQICRCCGTRTDRQIWIKLRYLLSYCRFLSAPYSRLFNAAQDLELTVQQFTLEGGSVLGGWKCRGRALLSREGGTVGVVPGVACEGVRNRPPRTKVPSRYKITLRRCLRERVAGVSTRSGGCIRLWRVELSALYLELLVGSCRIALPGQNYPPDTRSPSGAEKVTKTPSRAD